MQNKYKIYEDRALQLGAHTAKTINIKDTIVFGEWVRFKCQFGCPDYGTHLNCPPYMPDVDRCRDMILSYSYGICAAFHVDEKNHTPEKYRSYKNKIRKTLARIERQMFLDQYYKAFSLHNGPCTLCKECIIESKNEDEKKNKPVCRCHKVARPSMEAMGIDVFQTVKNIGWEPKVLANFFDKPTFYGLVLIE